MSTTHDPVMTSGSVTGLWRYPVKSMMGEDLEMAEVSMRGVLGDRAHALVDRETGKVASAKNPRKWPTLFDFGAEYTVPPTADNVLPPVRITLPDGTMLTNDQCDAETLLSEALRRDVTIQSADLTDCEVAKTAPFNVRTLTAEGYWPDIEGFGYRDIVTDFDLPYGTFFDSAVIHLLTTATLQRLQSLYPGGAFAAQRFRPNVLVEIGAGQVDFVENGWVDHILSIGDEVLLRVTKPCTRCVMTTLAQGDLPRDLEILRTVVKYNRAKVGVYARVLQGGVIQRGDPVGLL